MMTPVGTHEGTRISSKSAQVTLRELLDGVEHHILEGPIPSDLPICSVTADSREVVPGALFVAVRGDCLDGHDFLDEAVASGAAALLVEQRSSRSVLVREPGSVVIGVTDTREALGTVAATWYGNPAEKLHLLGITGTNGKTTCAYLLEYVLSRAGYRIGVIGTVDYRYRRRDAALVSYPAPFTTPDPLRLQAMLKEMVDNGVTHVIMEVSSHALEQRRLGSLTFEVAMFTNLSRDHLDYHRTMSGYFQAKCRLFSEHMVHGALVAVVAPTDERREADGWAEKIIDLCGVKGLRFVRCGTDEQAQYRLLGVETRMSGVAFNCRDEKGVEYRVVSPLVGRFNVDNLLACCAVLMSMGLDAELVVEALRSAPGAPGRMQRVELAEKPGGQPMVLVDYAHTPDALEKVLVAAADLSLNELWCVVGCGGDRDQGKRSLMGEIAGRHSDVVIVTDDNPRSEEPVAIRAQVMSGVKQSAMEKKELDWLTTRNERERGAVEIGDRHEAISSAVRAARQGDIVLLAGKGHETYQITNVGRRFFDDCLVAQKCSLLWDFTTVVQATKGTVIREAATPATRFEAVSTDSRTVREHDLFIALRGEVFDGHEFIDEAVAGGAGCLVISETSRLADSAPACVLVDDTLEALGELARWRRQAVKKMSQPVVVGLTGSCGKTTVKEMAAAIFNMRWPQRSDRPADRVLKTTGNFNNLIGLPLSLLPISAHHRAVVLEMGMNSPGEIARLTTIADPDIACILNIQDAHLEGLGSIEGVARAKAELFHHASDEAVLVVNLDDERVIRCAMKRERRLIGFAVTEQGRARNPEVWAEDIESDASGHLSLTLHVKEDEGRLTLKSPGLHNAINCCAAAAIAHAAGIGFPAIIAGLAAFRPATNRMETRRTAKGLNILNDTYNANPASMASGLATLARIQAENRLALLGDMLELGERSAQLHEEIGRRAADAGITFLGLVGRFSEATRKGALAGGMESERISIFSVKERAVDWVAGLLARGALSENDWVLVKASRGMALDTVVEQLMDTC